MIMEGDGMAPWNTIFLDEQVGFQFHDYCRERTVLVHALSDQ